MNHNKTIHGFSTETSLFCTTSILIIIKFYYVKSFLDLKANFNAKCIFCVSQTNHHWNDKLFIILVCKSISNIFLTWINSVFLLQLKKKSNKSFYTIRLSYFCWMNFGFPNLWQNNKKIKSHETFIRASGVLYTVPPTKSAWCSGSKFVFLIWFFCNKHF